MNNTPPKMPDDLYNHKAKYITSIVLGIIAVILAALGYWNWFLYGTSVVMLIISLIFSIKYFSVRKISIIALIVSISATMIVGYSIIRTGLVQISELLQNDYNSYYDYYNNYYDYGDMYDYFNEHTQDTDDADYWN